jgi:hypothetical protein
MLQWHRKIEASEDLDALLAVARDFLASFEPEDLATVPSQGRPTQVKGIDDLAYWHQRLVDCYCTGSAQGEGWEHVRSLLHFFAFAIQKAAELRGQPPIGEHEAAARLFSERSVPKLFTSATTGDL